MLKRIILGKGNSWYLQTASHSRNDIKILQIQAPPSEKTPALVDQQRKFSGRYNKNADTHHITGVRRSSVSDQLVNNVVVSHKRRDVNRGQAGLKGEEGHGGRGRSRPRV